MSVLYTDAAQILQLVGRLGVDLRLDHSPDADADLLDAAEKGTADVDYYCTRFLPADLANSAWVQARATLAAVRWLCTFRLNDVPESIEKRWKEYREELTDVRDRKAEVPRVAHGRRPAAVTNYHVDQRKLNNQTRVDRSRSTGRADGYIRPTDTSAPDER